MRVDSAYISRVVPKFHDEFIKRYLYVHVSSNFSLLYPRYKVINDREADVHRVMV